VRAIEVRAIEVSVPEDTAGKGRAWRLPPGGTPAGCARLAEGRPQAARAWLKVARLAEGHGRHGRYYSSVFYRVLALVAFVAALVLGVLAATSPARAHPGPNVVVDPPNLIGADSTPTVLVDPASPSHLVAVYRQDRPRLSGFLATSTDGGARWSTEKLPLPPGDTRAFDPDAAFGPSGTLYVVYVNLEGQRNVPANLWLVRSSNDGATLSKPQLVARGLTFQPRIAVGSDGVLHLTWVQAETQAPRAGVPQPVAPVGVMSASSVDGGRVFGAPVAVSGAGGSAVTGAVPVAYGKGHLSIAFEQFQPAPLGLGNGGSAVSVEPYSLEVTTSTDGGSSFGPAHAVRAGVTSPARFSLLLAHDPSLVAAPDGSLYLAWAARVGGEDNVLLARSANQGTRWTPPVRVNDNPVGDGSSRSLPEVAVAPDGRVDVAFLDRRNDPLNVDAEAYLAYSYDQGRNFANLKVSSEPFDTSIGPSFGGNLPADLGEHLGLASYNSGARIAWADSRLGTPATGRQDIFTAAASIPAALDAQRVALALGAALALLVSLALWLGPTLRWSRLTAGRRG
ncbi:MAG: sialidase family protein, partial [Acidimicrobiales bacterium]